MFVIYYFDNIFKVFIEVEDWYDEDKFTTFVMFLKSIYIQYDGIKFWNIPYKRIDEIIQWFEYYEYDYKFMPIALEAYNEFKLNNFKNESIFNRSKTFDFSVFTNEVIQYDYLKEGCEWGIKRSRVYIADDAGLGKTVEATGLISQLYKENKIDGCLVIVRNGTSYNWKKEIAKFSSVFNEEDIEIIFNENKIQAFNNYQDKKIIIISNHLLGALFASYRKDYDKIKRKLSKIRWKQYVNILKEWNKKSLAFIIDEAHELKNYRAVRTKSLITHKHFFNYRYLLSATPAINKIEDYWAQFFLLDESIIPYSENAFKIYLSKVIGSKYSKYDIKSYKEERIQELKLRISPYIIQRFKKDLPEVKTKQTIIPIYLEMSKKQKELYNLFIEYVTKELELEYDEITPELILDKKFPYIIQIIDNPKLLEGKVEDKKFNALLKTWTIEDDPRYIYLQSALNDYIGNLNEKVIVFDHHPKTLNNLFEKFKKYNPLLTHGEVGETEKTKFEKQEMFNDIYSKNKLYILSSLIGGASWNLNNACRREIFYNLPYNTILTRQSLDRTWRITSKDDSIVEILVIDKSLDYIRYLKNIKRIKINDNFLTKNLTISEIKTLFSGQLFTNN